MGGQIKTRGAPQRAGLHVIALTLFALIVGFAGITTLPPLDRDESRFAQATTQMLETGDFVTIRFQDRERNKKPAGIYWLQAASVSAFSAPDAREIWAYRLPSYIGYIFAVLGTYWAGRRLFDPDTGFLGALFFAATPLAMGEATIATTDSVLVATIVVAQAAFISIIATTRENRRASWGVAFVLWIAVGAGILLKGPITPMVLGLTGLTMLLRRPRLDWIANLRPITGILIVSAIVAPWAIAIGLATDGRFFTEAIGGDMLDKIGSGQESHGAPPGLHLVLLPILAWPAIALLAPGLMVVWRERANWQPHFLMAWIIPSWIVFELTATKLPHYPMPLYPALAITAAYGARKIITDKEIAAKTRTVLRGSSFLYAIAGAGGAGLIVSAPLIYGGDTVMIFCSAAAAAMFVASLLIANLFWRGQIQTGAAAAIILSGLFAWTLMNAVLPSLDKLDVPRGLSAGLDEAGLHPVRDNAAPAAIAGYHEPSAVFLIGTKTVLTTGGGAALTLAKGAPDSPRRAAIIESRAAPDFFDALRRLDLAVAPVAIVTGLNYSNGHNVTLTIYELSDQQSSTE